ncbi:MAG: hypothetical protein K2P59_01250, partial [Acetatifactor sp.]|nr:hypothetical protein [Acetatifactor sp.]
ATLILPQASPQGIYRFPGSIECHAGCTAAASRIPQSLMWSKSCLAVRFCACIVEQMIDPRDAL